MSDEVTVECECSRCRGTGLYVGLGERNGAAVVCAGCSGSGMAKLTYRPFEGRKHREGVTRIYATNPGVALAPGAVPGGVPYSAWVEGTVDPRWPGCEARSHSCPLNWYQNADYSKRPEWEECVTFGETISCCEHYWQKAKCWARWDEEQGR